MNLLMLFDVSVIMSLLFLLAHLQLHEKLEEERYIKVRGKLQFFIRWSLHELIFVI